MAQRIFLKNRNEVELLRIELELNAYYAVSHAGENKLIVTFSGSIGNKMLWKPSGICRNYYLNYSFSL